MEKLSKILIGLSLIEINTKLCFKFENIYLTKDSDHYIELSSNILFFILMITYMITGLVLLDYLGYPLIINIFRNFL